MIPKIELPLGFVASGVNSGVRRYRPDLGIVFSEKTAKAVGVFTRNSLKAAPVLYSSKLLPSENVRAILCNSGQANAATGIEGMQDNLSFATAAAQALGIEVNQVVVASTGVIGVRLPLEILNPAMPQVLKGFSNTINQFALAIMTTDLLPKFYRVEVKLSTGKVVLAGAAKGSGMIHPNMGTMLGFILTDADVELEWLNSEVKNIVDDTFNMISVDGETSTNDAVIVMANGAANAKVLSVEDKKLFSNALREIASHLAISIARDGEGASKLITVNVKNAPTREQARDAARSITTSPLIKSAMHGEDPNWGRILARLGFAQVDSACFEKLVLDLQGVRVFADGKPLPFDRKEARQKLHTDSILVTVDLKIGKFEATAWGCDLTKRYVEINTEYS